MTDVTGKSNNRSDRAWHCMQSQEVLQKVASTSSGLTQVEAQRRLEQHGPNQLPSKPEATLLEVFLRQFKSPLIYILLVAAVVAILVRDFTDAGFIGFILAVNALIGSWQEWRAEKSSRALQALLQVRASVVRDGHPRSISAEEVVPGDVIWVESGERVPADVRLLNSHGLEIDESLLTGESLVVTKNSTWLGPTECTVGDRQNMAFAGSIVSRGRGNGVVVTTAAETMVGQLAKDVLTASGARPPLMERMDRFSRLVALAVMAAALGIGSLGAVVHGYGILEMVMFGIALSVAAIPEGLPITITVALSIATTRMARRGVIVRRLAAVEGLGSCTLIASDKTGTLTVNELTVTQIRLPNGLQLDVSGQGFAPEGQLLHNGRPLQYEALSEKPDDPLLGSLGELLKIGVLCNEASLHQHSQNGTSQWQWRGDPTDVALLSLALKAGLEKEMLLADWPQINEIPFEPEHQYAATYHRQADLTRVYVKGAPERVVKMCHWQQASLPDELLLVAKEMADAGFRVLALASGDVSGNLPDSVTPTEPNRLDLIGFIGMIDPLREGVREAVAECQAAGIRVCMVTGDHPATALAIARQLGMAQTPDQVVLGSQILEQVSAPSDDPLRNLVDRARVFARVAPRQKLEIVNAARELGHFVAVTGDGVNDAPALRAANIGVAMGKSGTDVAREAAELIISDDNFSTIVAGVEEGRVAYDNIRKVIFLLVSTGAAEVCLLGLAVLSGVPLPLLPVQILWLNLVTSGIQDKPLALESAEEDVLRRPPRSPQEPIFNQLMIERTLVVAFVMASLGYASFVWMLKNGWSEPAARNGLLFFLVVMKTFHLGATRSETRYSLLLSPWKSPFLLLCAIGAVLVHLAAMYIPLLQTILGTQPIALGDAIFFCLVGLIVFLAMELHKVTWNLRHPQSG